MTGATGSIGSKVCKKLLKSGAKVVTFVRDQQKLESSLKLKDRRLYSNLIAINLDLTEPYQIENKFRQALSKLDG